MMAASVAGRLVQQLLLSWQYVVSWIWAHSLLSWHGTLAPILTGCCELGLGTPAPVLAGTTCHF